MLVAVSVLSGQSAVAIGIVAAPALSLMVVPFAFARRAKREQAATPSQAASEESDSSVSMVKGGGFAAAVLVIMFSEQAFLNAGPLVIRASQGAAAAGFIFNVLMIARAPLQLFQAISTSILPHLTSLHTSEEPGSEDEFHRSVRMVLLGHRRLHRRSPSSSWPPRSEPRCRSPSARSSPTTATGLLLVTLGMGLYLGSVTVNQACIAQGQVRRAAARWITCAALFIGWNFVPLVSNEFRRVEIGFLLAAGVLFVAPLLRLSPPPRTSRGRAEPGSPEELEARAGVIDENV